MFGLLAAVEAVSETASAWQPFAIAVIGAGGVVSFYTAWRGRKKIDADALATLGPIIASTLQAQDAKIHALEIQNEKIKAQLELLEGRWRAEMALRRRYEALLIENRIEHNDNGTPGT